jgi:hypothetical protein
VTISELIERGWTLEVLVDAMPLLWRRSFLSSLFLFPALLGLFFCSPASSTPEQGTNIALRATVFDFFCQACESLGAGSPTEFNYRIATAIKLLGFSTVGVSMVEPDQCI